MREVVVTGLGFITCLGRQQGEIVSRLQEMRHGMRRWEAFDDPKIPVSVAAPVPGFDTTSPEQEDWVYPEGIRLRLEQLRALSPNGLYALFAFQDAVADAGLSEEQISNPRTGLFTASAGSVMMTHHNVARMLKVGPMRCSPLGIVSSISGTLTFNLAATHHIQGASAGFVSACASSGHALGYAFDEIALGRQDRMFVVGAEDCTMETLAPFAGMRVLSPSDDPETASRPFDRDRDGFVGTGGAVVMVLEDADTAARRGARVYARYRGWGQATDGHHVAISHPEGAGLRRAMENALAMAGVAPEQIDYVNAHATSTPTGDASECRALKAVFGTGGGPAISSTKALTGHGLSLSSIMEAAFCVLAIDRGFMPGSAHIANLDSEADGLNIIRETVARGPECVLSNSSGFGGANVALVFGRKH